MDPLTAAALARYQYQLAFQAGGQGAAVQQALAGSQGFAAQVAALLPTGSGPAALVDLSAQALLDSASFTLAAGAGQGAGALQALVQQAGQGATASTTSLLPLGGFQDPATAAAMEAYAYQTAQRAGQGNAFIASLVYGIDGSPSILNTLV